MLRVRGHRAVLNGASQPFIESEVASREESQRLAPLPSCEVEIAGQKTVNGVVFFFEPQVPLEGVGVNKADVVVTVWRGETPCATSGLTGGENGNPLVGGQRVRERFTSSWVMGGLPSGGDFL